VISVRWSEFEAACPEIADLARERFAKDELVMLGTIRPDGSPRLSPCEVDLVDGRLSFGMMWQSHKALDLLRDQRLAVHSVPDGRMNPGGDVKLTGRAIDELDPTFRERYRETLRARIDWAPTEPRFHLFTLDVATAAYLTFGEGTSYALTWSVGQALERKDIPDPE
jgi:hypothetical protein